MHGWVERKIKREEREAYCAIILELSSQFDLNCDECERLETVRGASSYILQKNIWPATSHRPRFVELHFTEFCKPSAPLKRGMFQRIVFAEASSVTGARPYYKGGIDRGGFFFLFK